MKQIKLEIKSLNKEIIFKYKKFLINFLNLQNLKPSYIIMPTTEKNISLLKSTHINKKAQSQFELKTYKLIFTINTYFYTEKINSIIQKILFNKPKLVIIKFKIKL